MELKFKFSKMGLFANRCARYSKCETSKKLFWPYPLLWFILLFAPSLRWHETKQEQHLPSKNMEVEHIGTFCRWKTDEDCQMGVKPTSMGCNRCVYIIYDIHIYICIYIYLHICIYIYMNYSTIQKYIHRFIRRLRCPWFPD